MFFSIKFILSIVVILSKNFAWKTSFRKRVIQSTEDTEKRKVEKSCGMSAASGAGLFLPLFLLFFAPWRLCVESIP